MPGRLRIPQPTPAPPAHPDGGYPTCATCSGALVEGEPAAPFGDGRLEHSSCWWNREGLATFAALASALAAARLELEELRGDLEDLRPAPGLRTRLRARLERLRGRA